MNISLHGQVLSWLILGFLTIPQEIFAQADSIFQDSEIRITLDDCQLEGSVCLTDIPPSIVTDYNWLLDDSTFTGPFIACAFDTLSLYNYELLFGQGNAGPYLLDSWVVDGFTFTGIFQNIDDLVDSMNTWDPTGNWVDNPAVYNITGGDSQKQYSQMLVTVLQINTPSLIGYNFSLTPIATLIKVMKGVHQLIAISKLDGQSDTLNIIAGCATDTIVPLIVNIGESGSWCPDLSQLLTSEYAITNNCPASSGNYALTQTDPFSGCIYYTGTAVGQDTFCIEVCDTFGFCHTTLVLLEVQYPGANDAVQVYIYPGETIIFCPDTTLLPGQILSLVNICPGAEGSLAFLSLDSTTNCLSITGLETGGPVYACLVLCDDLGACDTQTVEIHVLFSTSHFDTLTSIINFVGTYCLDITVFSTSELNISDVCPLLPGAGLSYTLDSIGLCITYVGTTAGQEDLCLLLTDSLGNQDTLYLSLIVQLPVSDTLNINMFINDTTKIILNSAELAGPITTFFDACPAEHTGLINLSLDTLTLCATITGLTEGIGRACLVICDSFGICDTTYVQVTIESLVPQIKPIAVDDSVSTLINMVAVIPVLANDTFSLPGFTINVSPGTGPYRGQAVINLDGTITYTPQDNYCGPDFFRYTICNNLGCDAALVEITVHCTTSDIIQVYTGFSPNGDGINDYFDIQGIEKFPENKLVIYNRWGNLVYEKTNYQGGWDGTWQGSTLPDGTYYYILMIEGQEDRSGYVYIHR